jgi:hypothetical protein
MLRMRQTDARAMTGLSIGSRKAPTISLGIAVGVWSA